MDKGNTHIELEFIIRYLAGETTPDEVQKLLLWRNESEENQTQFEQVKTIWENIEKTSIDRNVQIEKEWRVHKDTYLVAEKSKVFVLRTFLKYAAGLFLLIGLSIGGWLYFSGNTIKTELAASNELILPDGSMVTLNAHSKLTYNESFGVKNRTVHLQGEAFFDVKKDANSPFIIKTQSADIKVIGTSFNVKAYPNMNKVAVTVAEGRVMLYEKDKESNQIIIGKGEEAIFDKQQGTFLSNINTDLNYNSWKTKLIVFENDSLPYILSTLSEVYHVEFVIINSKLNQCTLTTSFDNNDLGTVLKILKSTLSVDIEEQDEKIIISGNGC